MNTLSRFTGVALAATALFAVGCEKAEQIDISTLIARHTEARGGATALESVHAIQVRRDVDEAGRRLSTHYVATRDGRMRLDVFEDGRLVFSQGNNGTFAWQRTGSRGQSEVMPVWALAAVQRAVRHNLFALHELVAGGSTLTLAERDAEESPLHWVVDATDPDGYKRRLFIDRRNFLITRIQEHSAVNPDRSNYETDLDTFYADFRKIDGVVFSFESRTFSSESSGLPQQETSASEIIVNPSFDAGIFERPAAETVSRNDQ